MEAGVPRAKTKVLMVFSSGKRKSLPPNNEMRRRDGGGGEGGGEGELQEAEGEEEVGRRKQVT